MTATEAEKLHNVIILGASGFIGSSIFRHLKEKEGFGVTGHSSKSCNLLDQSQVAEALSSINSDTTIVLCSAIPRSAEDSWDAMLKNITMVHNLVSSIPGDGLKCMIFTSSTDIYGTALSNIPINEDIIPNPAGFYALSKTIAEHIFQLDTVRRYPVTHLRLPGIYGYGDGFRSIIGKFLKKVLDNEQIEITGDGSVKRDYVEIGDLCRVVEHFIIQPYDGPVNIATGKSTSIKDIVSIIAGIAGVDARIKWLDTVNSRGFSLMLDTKRLESLCPTLKFKDIENGVKHYMKQVNK